MKKIIAFLLVSTLIVGMGIFYNYRSQDALSRLGSSGSEVRKIQERLKKWGYYSGSVDGIYGTATKNISLVRKIRCNM